MALHGLIDTLFYSLKVLSMISFDEAAKIFDTEIFPQHTIADLIGAREEIFQGGRAITARQMLVHKNMFMIHSVNG